MSKKVMLMAGGTGGHVFPALSIAQALQAQGHSVGWLGTRQGLEARVVPAAGIPLFFLTIAGIRGAGLKFKLLAPFIIIMAIYQALVILRREKPDVVLGMGGFASGPGGVAAFLLRIPLIIHEQNAIPGLTNRLLAKVAKRVLQGFANSFAPSYKAITTGNPIRANIVAIAAPEQRLLQRQAPLRILILGGSQGALSLNELVPAALAGLSRQSAVEVRHQTGVKYQTLTQEKYNNLELSVSVEAFIEDMADAYAWADLLICRSGALTVAEIMATGVASILIPFPYAVDDHQRANAEILAQNDAAILINQAECDSQHLTTLLEDLVAHPQKLVQMAIAARHLSAKDATVQVVQHCLALTTDNSKENSK